jgi:hypothetical protein
LRWKLFRAADHEKTTVKDLQERSLSEIWEVVLLNRIAERRGVQSGGGEAAKKKN